MTTEPTRPHTETAEEAFAQFLLSEDRADPRALDALCRDYPDLEPDLRALHEGWRRVDGVLGAMRDGPPEAGESAGGASTTAPPPQRGSGRSAEPESLGRARVANSGSIDMLAKLDSRRPAASRYSDEGEVARGGMGSIHKVWDEDLRRHLAMKVILTAPVRLRPAEDGARPTPVAPLSDHDERLLGRFLDEAQVTGQLDHPGIVPVHELGLDADGRVFFTMRLVRGRNLKRIFDLVWNGDEGWNLTRAIGIVQKICEAMAYAHEKGVIHRDLKPANVMVGRFGEVYVMDWGLARVQGQVEGAAATDSSSRSARAKETIRTLRTDDSFDDSPLLTQDGDVVGTPAYMSPEQAGGKLDELGPKSDIYSVGAVMYHLLSGRMPYAQPGKRGGGLKILAALTVGPPAPLVDRAPGVPAELIAICERAMARRPEDRYPNMLAMARDLRAYLEGRVVRAYETGALAEFRKWVARNRGTAAGIAATVLAVIVGLGAFGWSETRAKGKQAALNSELETTNTALEAKNAELVATQAGNQALLDYRTAQVIASEAEKLYPAVPRMLPELDRWLATAAKLREQAGTYAAMLSDPRSERFGLAHPDLADMVARLAALEPMVAAVRARRERARTLEETSFADARGAWSDAADRLASASLYGGLQLSPQLGLVPLGENPEGLWEFWHVLSGARPEERGPDGHYRLSPDSGLILILMPGDTYRMGPEPGEVGRVGIDLAAQVEVEVEPYFLSKFEVTQAQWTRVMGSNPSRLNPARYPDDRHITELNPVESVSWVQSQEFARRLALELPTERYWEYACRAGSEAAFIVGDNPVLLMDYENLYDENPMTLARYSSEAWSDGFAVHAPVGSLLPNPMGFYDVAGNVSEWCWDVAESDTLSRERVYRGGSWYAPAEYARAAARFRQEPQALNESIGLRPGRVLEP